MSVLAPAASRIRDAEDYLDERTGHYAWRCVRYDAAIAALHERAERATEWHGGGWGNGAHTIDVGAGATEFGRRLFERDYRGRYWAVDAAFDGCDLNAWMPPRRADYFVALELLEHLHFPAGLVRRMQLSTRPGGAIVVSTPNPETTDVLGMDRTHVQPITEAMLHRWGFKVSEESFYGQPADSLLGVWTPT